MKILIVMTLLFVELFGIITVRQVDIKDKSAYSGSLKGSLETRRGNSEVDNYSGGVRVEYNQAKEYVVWTDAEFSYGEASGKINTNKKYIHTRFLHDFYERDELNSEAFVQLETNEFTNVKRRFLTGGGMRYHQILKRYGNLYFGLGGFYENISYINRINSDENNFRINTYIAYSKKFSKTSELSYTMYYQPNIAQVSDYIFSNALQLDILIYEKLYVDFVFYYDIDSKPAHGVEKKDVTQKTSLIYKF